MWLRRQLRSARGSAPEGNVMTKRIDAEDMNMDACARQQVEDDPIAVTTIWKRNWVRGVGFGGPSRTRTAGTRAWGSGWMRRGTKTAPREDG